MNRHKFWGIIIIFIGLSILFHFPFFNFIFALIIIWIGVRVLTGRRHEFWHESKGVLTEDYLRRVLVFSGINTKLDTNNFEGAELITIFGGGEVDASSVSTKRTDIDIDLVAIFGGLKLRIPRGWQVKSEGVGIIGGFDNNTNTSDKSKGTVIHLKGVAIFGGVEVVN